MQLQAPWVNKLSDGLQVKDIETTHKVMTALRRKLEVDRDAEEPARSLRRTPESIHRENGD
jgi:hypothetical protein